ncbi:MAG: ADP-ribosylglycohydrolase family protein [Candidatus Parabeggiatoa sp. nov. 3]|nr:MAG: ADP-ribosylglycohydrolase family protein [Gammaproteobacteria bacterium]RKZ68708.1 MAG: ADP-ribosylglycohydrolase family protein [Gammaproteobacteria bacterium]
MIGAIAGDMIGSVHESAHIKRTHFPLFQKNSRFTDDTVMTIAVAEAILHRQDYGTCLKKWGSKYPDRGYGGLFRRWLQSEDMVPYNSFGNGSAMRVSPVGFAFNKLNDVLEEAKRTAEVSHNHPEGIKGAQAIATAIFLARKQHDKQKIKNAIEKEFKYDLSRKIAQIRKRYTFDVICQGSVPEAIIAFLESTDLESAIRLGISLGGDADTIGCMAGGIAQAYYEEIPKEINDKVEHLLTPELLEIVREFNKTFRVNYAIV